MRPTSDQELIAFAKEARKNAYVPYSGFRVGAALLTKEGQVYTGCNIENAAYTPSNCAERTAFFKAVSEGVREFEAIAIVGGAGEEISEDVTAPCGVCRQVMQEFCNPDTFRIVLGKADGSYDVYLLKELLPLGFSL
jgi:cytidine deaminase